MSLSSKTQIALFGAGGIGRTHIDRITRSSNLNLAGIADPSDAAKAMAQSLNVPWFANHMDLLDSIQPQGAIVATPNSLHITQAVDCLERGVAALVEKPVADTVAEAQQLVDVQARTGVPVLVGHHRRHNPINRRARKIVQDGTLGRMVSANVMATFFKPDTYFDAAWRRSKGGGPILINLIHEIDMLRFLCGEITTVQALGSNAVRGFEVEDTAAAVLRFANGALGTVVLSDTATAPWCWDFCAAEQDQYPRQNVQSHFIAGTHGSLSLPDLQLWSYRGERSWYAEMTQEKTFVHKDDPYTMQLQHFAAVIAGAEAPLCSALDGLRTLQATLAVSEAASTGNTVQLPGAAA
ncbi:Gfo/Idh/MocA family oxidoreductase [Rhodoferax sp. GW822-FHT02A01]|uniref:Gfo/Idh/MocA family protein n=1 Tax=Rhodoferax sp. GW822-FHT02A01 TaxID=3141537 RepID=UPI00315C4E26